MLRNFGCIMDDFILRSNAWDANRKSRLRQKRVLKEQEELLHCTFRPDLRRCTRPFTPQQPMKPDSSNCNLLFAKPLSNKKQRDEPMTFIYDNGIPIPIDKTSFPATEIDFPNLFPLVPRTVKSQKFSLNSLPRSARNIGSSPQQLNLSPLSSLKISGRLPHNSSERLMLYTRTPVFNRLSAPNNPYCPYDYIPNETDEFPTKLNSNKGLFSASTSSLLMSNSGTNTNKDLLSCKQNSFTDSELNLHPLQTQNKSISAISDPGVPSLKSLAKNNSKIKREPSPAHHSKNEMTNKEKQQKINSFLFRQTLMDQLRHDKFEVLQEEQNKKDKFVRMYPTLNVVAETLKTDVDSLVESIMMNPKSSATSSNSRSLHQTPHVRSNSERRQHSFKNNNLSIAHYDDITEKGYSNPTNGDSTLFQIAPFLSFLLENKEASISPTQKLRKEVFTDQSRDLSPQSLFLDRISNSSNIQSKKNSSIAFSPPLRPLKTPSLPLSPFFSKPSRTISPTTTTTTTINNKNVHSNVSTRAACDALSRAGLGSNNGHVYFDGGLVIDNSNSKKLNNNTTFDSKSQNLQNINTSLGLLSLPLSPCHNKNNIRSFSNRKNNRLEQMNSSSSMNVGERLYAEGLHRKMEKSQRLTRISDDDELTFTPSITQRAAILPARGVISMAYDDFDWLQKKRAILKNQAEEMRMQQCTFEPAVRAECEPSWIVKSTCRAVRVLDSQRCEHDMDAANSRMLLDSYTARLKEHQMKAQLHRNEILKERTFTEMQECSFKPKTNTMPLRESHAIDS